MGVGAYFSAFLTVYYFGAIAERFPAAQNALLVVAVLAGGALAAVAGYLVGLPSLRLRGDYLAIVTLGFGEIIRVLILNIEKIGGARGLPGIPLYTNFFWGFGAVVAGVLPARNLAHSPYGRAL